MLFAEGLAEPEGPAVLADGSWLVVEMGLHRGCVTHISQDGQSKRLVAKTGQPNGLAIDQQGCIWVAERKTPSLLRVTLDGDCRVFLAECDSRPFLWPNDLAFGPDGCLYMTDSGIACRDFLPDGRFREDYLDIDYDGRVYKIDTRTGGITQLDSGLRYANGICFDAHDNLYVSETITGMVYRYEWRKGELGPRRGFGNVIAPDAPQGLKGPDGIKFGADGNLYVAVFAQGDVTVLGPEGQLVRRIKTAGARPTNLAFGQPGDHRIYVTEVELGNIEVFDMPCTGLALHGSPVAR